MRVGTRANLGLALLTAMLSAGCSGDGQADKPAQGQNAPESPSGTPVLFRFEQFTGAPRVDGGEITLRSLEGKVVLLDLFGTWCSPCRRSIPLIVSLHQRFSGKDLEVVGLAYERTSDEAQARAKVKAFSQEFDIPYTLALGPDQAWQELAARAGAEGVVPTLLLIDRQGIVRYMFQGLKPGEEAVLAEQIERLLAEPAVPVAR
ncbi:MAG: TlpA disulfide reductase family protein [Planctomycetota bacterium]|nr:TlpA disulfide reductase family protein [Planctomycetota bacterium]